MNLMPTLISIGLAASVSLFYLQNQSDKPKEINYRAALSEFEQSAIAFAAHTPLDSNNPQPNSHCQNNMLSDFSKRLPAGSQWTVNIAGLDCDTAILSLTSANSDDFNNLLSAARASGRSYATETDTSVTPPTKTIKWTQRLYTRTASDLGIRAQLKNNRTNSCLDNPCSNTILMPVGTWQKKGGCSKTCDGGIQQYECIGGKCSQTKPNTQCNTDPCPAIGKWQEDGCTETCGTGIQQYKCIGGECNTPKPSQSCNTNPCPVNGGWSHKDEDDWEGCPAMPTCGSFTETRQCNNPTPQNGGTHCPKLDGTFTTASNLSETRNCRKIGLCGPWGSPTAAYFERDCFTDLKTHTEQILQCNGISGCKHNGKYFKNGETFTQLIECPRWSNWNDSTECIGTCGSDGKKWQKRTCDFKNELTCKGLDQQQVSCESPCGNWIDQVNCATTPKTCLRPGEKGPIKRVCNGTDKQFKCIDNITKKVFNHGKKEYCDTLECGNWGGWSEPDKKCITENEPDHKLTQTCNGKDGCKNHQNEFFKHNELDTKSANLPKCTWTDWGDWSECDVSCGEYGKQSRTRNCTNNTLNCNREETQWQRCKGSCGKWENTKECPKGICLKDNEIDPIKRTCNGGDKKYQCISTDTGDTHMHNANEYCGTPRCGEWTEFGECPNPQNTCLEYGENELYKALRCDSDLCERDGKFYNKGYVKKESCNIPTCGNFSKWSEPKNHCYKEGDPEYETITRTCNSENGCKVEDGIIVYGTQSQNIELPKCGKWSDWSECKAKNNNINNSCDEVSGIQTRICSAKACPPDSSGISAKEKECFLENCTWVIGPNYSNDKEINIFHHIKEPSKRKVLVQIHKDTKLIAQSTDKCAINSGGKFKELTIEVDGLIFGKSGDGGEGGGFTEFQNTWLFDTIPTLNGEDGKDGGSAICINEATPAGKVEIKNSDRVSGGQGGGGGGGGICAGYYDLFTPKGYCFKGGDGGDGFYYKFENPKFRGKEGKGNPNGPKSGKGGNGGSIINDNSYNDIDIETATSGSVGSKPDEYYFSGFPYNKKHNEGAAGKAGKAGSKCKVDSNHHKVKGCD